MLEKLKELLGIEKELTKLVAQTGKLMWEIISLTGLILYFISLLK